jgi:hypothetical protein
MRILARLSPLVALAAAAGLSAPLAGAQPAPSDAGRLAPQCFSSNDWSGWKATPDSRTLYIRVGIDDVYRLDLAYTCPDLHNIDARISNRVREGEPRVCGPLDLDLTIFTPPGESSPCMVKAITPMTHAQAAALPRSLKP